VTGLAQQYLGVEGGILVSGLRYRMLGCALLPNPRLTTYGAKPFELDVFALILSRLTGINLSFLHIDDDLFGIRPDMA
jgi:hypothetical protein